jgi:uncharacterized membrane protein (DUF106 family)
MARIERRVRELVDDPEMRAAVETVLERADDGTVRWVDVREDITSGQWGRLIEKGILVDGDEGFELDDVDATRAALVDDDESAGDGTDGEAEGTSWSIYDKGAAGVTMLFFVAYSWRPLREVIGGVMDVVLGPLEQALPFYVVVMVLALATGIYSTLLQAILMNTEKIGEVQEKMQDLQERREAAKERDDQAALDRLEDEQMEMMGDQLGMFKEQFRPMVWIMFLTIPVFLWMYWKVGIGDPSAGQFGTFTIPFRGTISWKDRALGPIQTWIIWYFLCSMAFTQVVRKGLNIDISPTG